MNHYCGFIGTLEKVDKWPDERIIYDADDVKAAVREAFRNSATQVLDTRHNGAVGIAFFNFSNHDGGVRGMIAGLFEELSTWGHGIYGFCSAWDDEIDGGDGHFEYKFNYPPIDFDNYPEES